MSGFRYRVDTCRSCAAPIIWARTKGGKSMPVDADPVDDGNVELAPYGPDGAAATVLSGPSLFAGDRYVSHFATCPNAGEWRRRDVDHA